MRYTYFISAVFLLTSLTHAQTKELKLVLNYLYEGETFIPNNTYLLEDSTAIQISRLSYYLNINEIYSNSDSVEFQDKYLLVKTNNNTYTIGDVSLTNLTKMRFHLGVDPALNHEDPALWPNNHPLAPKVPSMHWGWTAGYIFIAIEAFLDTDGDDVFETPLQHHALSDDFYLQFLHDIVTTEDESSITIHLNMNYEKLLDNSSSSQGGIFHGAQNENMELILNFRQNDVITNPLDLSIQENSSNNNLFSLSPNPVYNMLSINGKPSIYEIKVYDVLGAVVYSDKQYQMNSSINLEHLKPGTYILKLKNDHKHYKFIKY
jgi:hypothetical protein